jgi:hypothetical protein
MVCELCWDSIESFVTLTLALGEGIHALVGQCSIKHTWMAGTAWP